MVKNYRAEKSGFLSIGPNQQQHPALHTGGVAGGGSNKINEKKTFSYWCYYQHTSRYLVLPVCGFFFLTVSGQMPELEGWKVSVMLVSDFLCDATQQNRTIIISLLCSLKIIPLLQTDLEVDKLYEPKQNKKIVRIFTVILYMFSVRYHCSHIQV